MFQGVQMDGKRVGHKCYLELEFKHLQIYELDSESSVCMSGERYQRVLKSGVTDRFLL